VPTVVGVPEITPVDAFRVVPVGTAPEMMVYVYGLNPPFAEMVSV
jgi:hypothetical protein